MTQIFAHRGSAGTHPENTMISFKEALRVGADGIELDVQLSSDREVVVIHDEKLDRTTNGHGFVKDHTVKKLQALDAGYKFSHPSKVAKIPLLEEVLIWLKDTHLLCNIELKNGVFPYHGMEEKVVQLIRMYGLENQIIVSSFNHYSLVYFYQLAPEIEIAPLYRDSLYMPWVYAKAIRAKAIHPSISVAPVEVIIAAIKEKIDVRPYTVNDEDKMIQLFNISCSAIITDFPEKAVKLRKNAQ